MCPLFEAERCCDCRHAAGQSTKQCRHKELWHTKAAIANTHIYPQTIDVDVKTPHLAAVNESQAMDDMSKSHRYCTSGQADVVF